VQLYTVAHECGHIFLHNSGSGYTFAGHVKEFEASSGALAYDGAVSLMRAVGPRSNAGDPE
jgi:hypothetical protein